MVLAYKLAIKLYGAALKLAAPFNNKAATLTAGRRAQRHLWQRSPPGPPCLWFHFASLGEFEQGRPVIEALRQQYPLKRIVLTFFSPSGYLPRQHYKYADDVLYLPADTAANALGFVNWLNPQLAIFTKYEYWYFYFKTLHAAGIPLIVISAHFTAGSIFARPWGMLHRQMLQWVTRFFVQDSASRAFLAAQGIPQVTIGGDTRADSVLALAARPFGNNVLADFTAGHKILIAGSTWPADDALLAGLNLSAHGYKLIIAPHDVSPARISQLQRSFPAHTLYMQGDGLPQADTLILNTMGVLAYAYRYAHIAYIGGGFNKGIHNTLEAAVYGLPVIFGPKYHRFLEARQLIAAGAAAAVSNLQQLEQAFADFNNNTAAGNAARNYVLSSKGATHTIMAYIRDLLQG